MISRIRNLIYIIFTQSYQAYVEISNIIYMNDAAAAAAAFDVSLHPATIYVFISLLHYYNNNVNDEATLPWNS